MAESYPALGLANGVACSRGNAVGFGKVGQGMKVAIYSDVVCPWCAIGKRRFESAMSRFEHADEVEVEWRAFELDPNALAAGGDYVGRLARKYGISREQAVAPTRT